MRAGAQPDRDDDASLPPAQAAAFHGLFERARALIDVLRARPRDPMGARVAALEYVRAADAAGVSRVRTDDALDFLVAEHGEGRWTAAELHAPEAPALSGEVRHAA
jgi:hypothetical protein